MPWTCQRWWTLPETCTWERRNTRRLGRSALPDWDVWASTRAGWFQVCIPPVRSTVFSEWCPRRHRSGYCKVLMELLEQWRAGETVLPAGIQENRIEAEKGRGRETGGGWERKTVPWPRSSKGFGVQTRRRNKEVMQDGEEPAHQGTWKEKSEEKRRNYKNASVNVIIRKTNLTQRSQSNINISRLQLCTARFYSGVNQVVIIKKYVRCRNRPW